MIYCNVSLADMTVVHLLVTAGCVDDRVQKATKIMQIFNILADKIVYVLVKQWYNCVTNLLDESIKYFQILRVSHSPTDNSAVSTALKFAVISPTTS